MSYILDALRRADSDRERGAVPSLHSNPLAAGPIDADEAEDGSARAVQPLWWAVGGLSVVLLGMLGWLIFARSAPEPQRPPEVVAAPAVPVTPAPVVTAPPVMPPPAVAAAPAQVAPPVQEPSLAPSPAPAPRTAAVKPGKPVARPDPTPARAAPAAPPPVTEPEAVPSISELPDDVRRQLPSLSVSGASYSRNAASRMLILNGQVFREGDKVANDVVLEQIRLKSAVLSYKGRRYSISF